MNRPFELSGRLRSFKYAGRGIWLMLKSQHNAWIHAAATIAVLVAGIIFKLSRADGCLIVLACAAVWTAEALNTAIEFLADTITQEQHPLIGQAKDVAAGAVLIAAVAAAIVGILVFTPYATAWLSR